MPLENLTGPSVYLNALVNTNPAGTDTRREGDQHIQGVKNVLLNTFPNVVGAISASDDDLTACENFEEAVVATLTPTLFRVLGRLRMDGVVYFDGEFDEGDSGTTETIDWAANGNRQRSRLTGNVTFTFTAPPGASNLILKVVQDGTGSRTATWPAAVDWQGGSAPTLSTAPNAVDLVTFYYDGTTYFGQFAGAFS